MGKASSKQVITEKSIKKKLENLLKMLELMRNYSKKKVLSEKAILKTSILSSKIYRPQRIVKKCSKIIKSQKLISASRILIYYTQHLIKHAKLLHRAQKNVANPKIKEISHLSVALMSIIWSSQRILFEDINQFVNLIRKYYSERIIEISMSAVNIDPVVCMIIIKLLLNFPSL